MQNKVVQRRSLSNGVTLTIEQASDVPDPDDNACVLVPAETLCASKMQLLERELAEVGLGLMDPDECEADWVAEGCIIWCYSLTAVPLAEAI